MRSIKKFRLRSYQGIQVTSWSVGSFIWSVIEDDPARYLAWSLLYHLLEQAILIDQGCAPDFFRVSRCRLDFLQASRGLDRRNNLLRYRMLNCVIQVDEILWVYLKRDQIVRDVNVAIFVLENVPVGRQNCFVVFTVPVADRNARDPRNREL